MADLSAKSPSGVGAFPRHRHSINPAEYIRQWSHRQTPKRRSAGRSQCLANSTLLDVLEIKDIKNDPAVGERPGLSVERPHFVSTSVFMRHWWRAPDEIVAGVKEAVGGRKERHWVFPYTTKDFFELRKVFLC